MIYDVHGIEGCETWKNKTLLGFPVIEVDDLKDGDIVLGEALLDPRLMDNLRFIVPRSLCLLDGYTEEP